MKEKHVKMKKSYNDKIFDIINVLLMCILVVIFVWPLWFIVIASFSDPNEVWLGHVLLLPKGFTTIAYQAVAEYGDIWIGYRNTILYTVVGTLVNMVLTIWCRLSSGTKRFHAEKYPDVLLYADDVFQRRPDSHLPGGKQPAPDKYLLGNDHSRSHFHLQCHHHKDLFINSIPKSLEEAAELDGANTFQLLIKVVLPLSKPILAVIGLYYAVGHWNDFYTGIDLHQ